MEQVWLTGRKLTIGVKPPRGMTGRHQSLGLGTPPEVGQAVAWKPVEPRTDAAQELVNAAAWTEQVAAVQEAYNKLN